MNKKGLIKKGKSIEKELEKDADIVIREVERDIIFIRKIAISLAGFTLLLVGFALLFIPGPGILFIILGLSLLAAEFLFARLIIRRIKNKLKEIRKAIA